MDEIFKIIKEATPFLALVLTIVMPALLLRLLKKGYIGKFSLGKEGLTVEAIQAIKKIEGEDLAQAIEPKDMADLSQILTDQIIQIDEKMVDFAIHQSDVVRRKLLYFLDSFIKFPLGKQTISEAVRHPLYNAARRNKFRKMLTPINMPKYINALLQEIKLEYAAVEAEHTGFLCPINQNSNCINLPPWQNLEDQVRDLLLKDWAYPIKEYRIKISQDKIDRYNEYLKIFKILRDEFNVAKTQQRIKKNECYISELSNGGNLC